MLSERIVASISLCLPLSPSLSLPLSLPLSLCLSISEGIQRSQGFQDDTKDPKDIGWTAKDFKGSQGSQSIEGVPKGIPRISEGSQGFHRILTSGTESPVQNLKRFVFLRSCSVGGQGPAFIYLLVFFPDKRCNVLSQSLASARDQSGGPSTACSSRCLSPGAVFLEVS